jgi:hypothetical protein
VAESRLPFGACAPAVRCCSSSSSHRAPGAAYEPIQRIDDVIPLPPEVKWDLFVGPSPMRPWNPMYTPRYDIKKERFTNSETANGVLQRKYREGWPLPA